MMTTNDTTPRAWIGCLACYNAGRLVGEWVDGLEAGEFSAGDLPGHSQAAGDDPSPHEELWVFDHQGYGPALSGECSPAEAQSLAEDLDQVDDMNAYAAYVDYVGRPYADPAGFEDAYAGEWDSLEDYARELADDVYGVETAAMSDGVLVRYFDYAAFSRDLFMSDYASAPAPGGGVYVFRTV